MERSVRLDSKLNDQNYVRMNADVKRLWLRLESIRLQLSSWKIMLVPEAKSFQFKKEFSTFNPIFTEVLNSILSTLLLPSI